MAAALAALTLMLLVNLLLSRAVIVAARQAPRGNPRDSARGETSTTAQLEPARRDRRARGRLRPHGRASSSALHAHLEALALKDPLTGLLNHRAFKERLEQELRRAEREGYSVAVVAIDVDHFKEINDRWGHAVRRRGAAHAGRGDPGRSCARATSAAASAATSSCSRIVRSDVEEAEQVVERLRETIADIEFGPAGQTLTISAGISEFPRHSLSREELHAPRRRRHVLGQVERPQPLVRLLLGDATSRSRRSEAGDRVARDGARQHGPRAGQGGRRQGRLHPLALPARGAVRGRRWHARSGMDGDGDRAGPHRRRAPRRRQDRDLRRAPAEAGPT